MGAGGTLASRFRGGTDRKIVEGDNYRTYVGCVSSSQNNNTKNKQHKEGRPTRGNDCLSPTHIPAFRLRKNGTPPSICTSRISLRRVRISVNPSRIVISSSTDNQVEIARVCARAMEGVEEEYH